MTGFVVQGHICLIQFSVSTWDVYNTKIHPVYLKHILRFHKNWRHKYFTINWQSSHIYITLYNKQIVSKQLCTNKLEHKCYFCQMNWLWKKSAIQKIIVFIQLNSVELSVQQFSWISVNCANVNGNVQFIYFISSSSEGNSFIFYSYSA